MNGSRSRRGERPMAGQVPDLPDSQIRDLRYFYRPAVRPRSLLSTKPTKA